MKILLALMVIVVMLPGCASTGVKQAEVERITPEQLAKILPPPVAKVSLDEIIADSKVGKTSNEIIEKIKASNSRYELTTTQTLDLSKQGVDIKVLDYIQQSNELAKQNAIADEMNKRARERAAAEKILKRERDLARDQLFYDPFWGPHFYGYPYYGFGSRFGHRFGFGLNYGYPYGGWY